MVEIQNEERLSIALAATFGTDMAQSIVACMRQCENSGTAAPSYMEVKALSEVLEMTRKDAQCAIRGLKRWCKAAASNYTHPTFARQGAFASDRYVEAMALYKEARANFWSAYHEAMALYASTPTVQYQTA